MSCLDDGVRCDGLNDGLSALVIPGVRGEVTCTGVDM